MVFPVVGGDGKPTGYEIDNSLRFNDDDSPYLSRTPSTATNNDKLTFSFWTKRSNITLNQKILTRYSSSDNRFYVGWTNSDVLNIYQKVGGTESFYLQTNRVFRDSSAWYHIVVAYDTTQSTEANRIKLYVNGTQETSFATSNYPSQNLDLYYQTATSVVAYIGQYTSSQYYDGYFSDMHLIDGQQLDSSYFGETNDNGVWIPKEYTGTYGDEGFKLEFKQTGTGTNSSGMGADTSGNDNHWAVNNLNAYDVVPDSPTNNYCVLNSVDKDGHTNAEGNLEVSGNVIYGMQRGTIGATSGKWYFEARLNTYQGDTAIALANEDENIFTRFSGETTNSVGYLADNRFFYNSGSTNYSSLSAGNIFQIAFDADTGKIWIGKNNTWQNSGDPANGTGSVQTVSWNFFLPAARTVGSGVLHYNFGQDSSFGGHSTAQNNADGNGYGDFYYAPPTGFFALNTKNLAEFG